MTDRTPNHLSQRQCAILSLVAKGRANKEIAAELTPPCRVETVKTHLRAIYAELDVANRAEAAAFWVEWYGPHHGV